MSTTPSAIGQLGLRVRDIARAVRFYRDALGLPLLFEVPGLAFFRCGETRLMLTAAPSPEFDHPASAIYLRVADIEARMAALHAAGARIHRPAQLTHRDANHELWIGWFDDGEDNLLALMEERPLAN